MNDVEYAKSLSDHDDQLDYFYNVAIDAAKLNTGMFVEIGTRMGGTAILLLAAIKNSNNINIPLITIDPYGNKPYPQPQHGEGFVWKMDYGEEFYRRAMHEIAKFAYDNKMTWVNYRMKSQDWIEVFPKTGILLENEKLKEKYSFAYLDGEHYDVTVNKELEYFMPRMVPNGMIVIDDIENLENSDLQLVKTVMSSGTRKGNRIYFKNSL